MKLLTQANRQALPPLYSQDGKGMDAVAYGDRAHEIRVGSGSRPSRFRLARHGLRPWAD